MPIATDLIPQADKMEDVIKIVEAVHEGYHSDKELADFIGKQDRQGRYYRKACEILGFIKNYRNHSELTQKGKEFLEASKKDRMLILQEAIINNPIFKLIVDDLKEKYPEGLTQAEITNIIKEQSATTLGMLYRRTHSVINWLKDAKIANEKGAKLYLVDSLPGPVIVEEIKDSTKQITAVRHAN